eukprot:COSAG02_NODE_1707_length_11230_cov_3.141946_2_plen_77_part_00
MTMSAPRRAFCHQFSVPNREIPRVFFSSWLRMPQTSKILYQYDLSSAPLVTLPQAALAAWKQRLRERGRARRHLHP